MVRTFGGRVACGGSKCSSSASFRLARASSSVSPRVATSSSKHWETYHFPSRQTVAANGRFMTSFFHRAKLTRTLDVEMDGILPPMPGGRVMIEGTSHTESRKLYARDG